ncbi:hypothetical protein ThrDRAFT_04843, partial [Frankia casuarinae]
RARILTPPPAPAPRTPSHTVYLHKQTLRVTLPYTVSQGTLLHRTGRVHISADADGTVWIGGDTITCVSGFVEL